MDQSHAPMLEALADYHRLDRHGFTPPGHRQGRGADERVTKVLGIDPFRSDVLAASGLDDRTSSNGYLAQAEDLMQRRSEPIKPSSPPAVARCR